MQHLPAFNQFITCLARQRHRHCMVLTGDFDWRIVQLRQLETRPGLWIGQTSPLAQLQPLALDQLRHHLGQETGCAVFCFEQGIDADALGIVSGMIQAGGLLWILLPSDWLDQPNPANQRCLNYPKTLTNSRNGFNRLLNQILQQQAIWWHQYQAFPSLPRPETTDISPHPTLNRLNTDQQRCLEAIRHLAFGHPKRPLLIEADRGRGKTALLGEAAAQLLLEGKQRIIISAARLSHVETAFKHAALILKPYEKDLAIQPGLVTFDNKTIEFKAPDDLVLNKQNQTFDVLMLDEAAHLPLPLLQQLVTGFPRVVLSTTLHGYEGSGRGFGLKFKPFLTQTFKHWHHQTLDQPIRWAEGDPLESCINQALLLDAELEPLIVADARLTIDQLDTNHLTTEQLKPIFALLVQAHYQTSPADLQQLLSSPDFLLFVGYRDTQCVGVLWVTKEGGLSPLSRQRRVKGHLVPQLLRQISGQDALLADKSERVMRLAVHPKCQRQGIASQLINHWLGHSQADYVSASFGVSLELYYFWRKQGFLSIHLGAKRDKASGSHNLVMISARHPDRFQRVLAQFQSQLPHSLMEFICHLPPALELALLAEHRPTCHQTFDFSHYLEGSQSYESLSHQLWQWTLSHADKLVQVNKIQQAVWLDKVLRKQAWSQVANRYQLAGRKAVENLLKTTLEQALKIKDS